MRKPTRKRILKDDLNPIETREFFETTGMIFGNDDEGTGWKRVGTMVRESSVPYGKGQDPQVISITVELTGCDPVVFKGPGMTDRFLTYLQVEGERLERELLQGS